MAHVEFSLARADPWGETRVTCECGVTGLFQTATAGYVWHSNHKASPYRIPTLTTRPGAARSIVRSFHTLG